MLPRVGTPGLRNLGSITIWITLEFCQRLFAGKQVDAIAEKHAMLARPCYCTALVESQHRVVARHHGAVGIRILQEPLLLGRPTEDVSSIAMNRTVARIACFPGT